MVGSKARKLVPTTIARREDDPGPAIWDLIFSGDPMTGTSNDDFMFGYAVTSAVDNDIDGNLGDDLIIGDIGNFRTLSGAAANGSLATAFDLDSALSAWTAGENALVQGSTILPHITVYVEATAGDDEWFRFSIPTGTGPAAFYIDVDYGVSAIGISTDTVIELYDSAGLLLASNDTSPISDGGFGSSSDQDPFINYTELTGGTFYVRILEAVTSTPNFEGGETFLLNISAGAHPASAAPPAGNDTIDGDDDYGDSGQDQVFGGGGVLRPLMAGCSIKPTAGQAGTAPKAEAGEDLGAGERPPAHFRYARDTRLSMLAHMSDYKVHATDSAGTQFLLGSAEEALKVLAFLNSVARARPPIRDIVIVAPDGSEIDRAELRRRAQEEAHAIALERAGRTYIPGRPPGE